MSSTEHAGSDGLPQGHAITELHSRRAAKNQDLLVAISDWHSRRGTGKSTLTLQLADACDTTPDGLTFEKCTMSASELLTAYTEQPEGSALVLDEAEQQLSKYRAGTHTNKAIRDIVSMGRVLEKYVFLNMPAAGELDRDLLKLCDLWILVENRGRARAHLLPNNPYIGDWYPKKIDEPIRWPDISEYPYLEKIYDKLTEEKMRRLTGDHDDDSLVRSSDVEDRIRSAVNQAERDTRKDLIRQFYTTTELTQQEVGKAVGLSRSRIADILTE